MPKIPEFSNRPSMVPDSAPGVDISPNAFGRVQEAISNVGAQVANFAGDLIEKRRAAEDADFANRTLLNDSMDLDSFSQQAKLDSGGDFKGYTDKIKEFVNQRMSIGQENAPSERARQLYFEHASPKFAGAIIEANSTEYKQRAEWFQSNVDDSIQKSADQLVSFPNVRSAYDRIDATTNWIGSQTGTAFDAASGKKKIELSKQTQAQGLVAGLYAQALQDPKNWATYAHNGIDVLNGQDPESLRRGSGDKISDYLNPGHKATLLDEFSRLIKEKTKTNLTELHAFSRESIQGARDGKIVGTAPNQMWDQAIALGATEPESKARFTTELAAASQEGIIKNRLANTSFDQHEAIINGIDRSVRQAAQDALKGTPGMAAAQESTFMQTEIDQGKARLMAESSRLQSEFNSDPATYVFNHDSSVRSLGQKSINGPQQMDQYIRSSKARQVALGADAHETRVLPKEDIQALGRSLTNPSVGEDIKANAWTNAQKLYGSNWTDVLHQAVNDHVLSDNYTAIGLSDNNFDRQTMIASIQNATKTKALWDQRTSDEKNALKDAVRKQIEPFQIATIQGSVGGYRNQFVDSITDMVHTKAAQLMLGNEAQNPDDAATRAMKMITNTFHIVNTGNSVFIMPKVVSGKETNPDLVKGFINSHTSDEALDALPIRLPGGQKWFDSLPSSDQKPAFYQTLRKTGHWVTNGNQTGMFLEYIDPNRGRTYVGDSSRLNKRGQPLPLEIPFNSVPMDKFTSDEVKGFWGRLKQTFTPKQNTSKPTNSFMGVKY